MREKQSSKTNVLKTESMELSQRLKGRLSNKTLVLIMMLTCNKDFLRMNRIEDWPKAKKS